MLTAYARALAERDLTPWSSHGPVALRATRSTGSLIPMRIVTGMHQIGAEATAGRLRSAGIAARVLRDNEALLGVVGASSLGTFSVEVADADVPEARRALRLLARSAGSAPDGDAPFSANAILLAVIVLAFGLVALYGWSLIGF